MDRMYIEAAMCCFGFTKKEATAYCKQADKKTLDALVSHEKNQAKLAFYED